MHNLAHMPSCAGRACRDTELDEKLAGLGCGSAEYEGWRTPKTLQGVGRLIISE